MTQIPIASLTRSTRSAQTSDSSWDARACAPSRESRLKGVHGARLRGYSVKVRSAGSASVHDGDFSCDCDLRPTRHFAVVSHESAARTVDDVRKCLISLPQAIRACYSETPMHSGIDLSSSSVKVALVDELLRSNVPGSDALSFRVLARPSRRSRAASPLRGSRATRT